MNIVQLGININIMQFYLNSTVKFIPSDYVIDWLIQRESVFLNVRISINCL